SLSGLGERATDYPNRRHDHKGMGWVDAQAASLLAAWAFLYPLQSEPPIWSTDRSRLQLAQPIGQHPQRPVEADVLVDALHRAGALGAPIALATRQAALDQVLLRTVEQRPQIRTPVVETTRHEDLFLG